MTSVPPLPSAALTILQQANLTATSSEEKPATATDFLAAANGVPSTGSTATDQARKKVSEALFDQSVPDANKLKIALMERLGSKFGLAFEDFETASAFGTAVQSVMNEMRYKPGASAYFREIERDLGLDELGITLDQFVNSIVDPESSDGEKVDKALSEKVGELAKGSSKDGESPLTKLLEPDESGLYGR